MPIDENEFFRQASMQILSSLDIETAMWRAMQFLRNYIPAEEMYLHLYEIGLGALRTIAKATASKGTKMDRITPLPPEVRRRVIEFSKSSIINNPEMEQGFEYMLRYYSRPDTSALVRLLEVENQKLGALVILAPGRNRFSEEQGRLFSILNEPFAMALSNTLKHQEVLRLKDLLADDNR
ncbi:MAG TPA: hypothetical protein VK564_13170, partial [Thermodesulfobacteriota bacterium]|nr:hypothetical protein [Thermodesulfobacteriota bacterium]